MVTPDPRVRLRIGKDAGPSLWSSEWTTHPCPCETELPPSAVTKENDTMNKRCILHAVCCLSLGLLLAPENAAAQVIIVPPAIIPPGCGSYSGQPLAPGWTIADYSGSATSLGSVINNIPFP